MVNVVACPSPFNDVINIVNILICLTMHPSFGLHIIKCPQKLVVLPKIYFIWNCNVIEKYSVSKIMHVYMSKWLKDIWFRSFISYLIIIKNIIGHLNYRIKIIANIIAIGYYYTVTMKISFCLRSIYITLLLKLTSKW